MAHDYYPLLARAVALRRYLYERARSVLRAQVQDHQPSLPASERMDEMLALEQAIRKVEVEAIVPPTAFPCACHSVRSSSAAPIRTL
jgi:hypothetical protein